MTMNVLNPYTLPLDSSALIEASAGTGKTFTITTLYLRAVLGLINEGDDLTPLSLEQILVVTFTEAATQEIKDRVRSKLLSMQKFIIGYSVNDDTDPQDPNRVILHEYCKRAQKQGGDRALALKQAYDTITHALLLIDEASIFTIHGFCNRCLNRFAFESKISFEQSFEMDNQEYISMAVYDFWRRHVAQLTGLELSLFRKLWKSPEALLQAINSLVNREIVITPEAESASIADHIAKYQTLLKQVRTAWLAADFSQVIQNSGLKRTIKTVKRLSSLEPFLAGEKSDVDFAKGEGWSLYSSAILADAKQYKAKSELIELPIIQQVDELVQVQEYLDSGVIKAMWLNRAKCYVEQRSEQIKTEKSVLTPDDLLLKLYQAMAGDKGDNLSEAIRKAFPLAMVDEFQDTDAIQYGIFENVYLGPTSAASMFMIGDPKQAIYKFRGADIFTYIAAKKALPESSLYTLDTNWRSHPKLVAAVNHLFVHSDKQFDHELIPFQSVKSGKSGQIGLVEQGQVQALDVNFVCEPELGEGIKAGDAEIYLARLCAAQIKTTLVQAEQGGHCFTDGESATPVTAGDICVLVRTRRQASLIKQQLAKLAVSSVFISRDSIFRAPLAKDFLRLLKAIHEPQSESKVRAALSGTFFNFNLAELRQIFESTEQWHQYYNQFYLAHEHWIAGRLALAVQTATEQQQSLASWLTASPQQTNRMATDYRHLIELLQLKAKEIVGNEKLVSWFEEQILATESHQGAETSQVRLESDANLVQIATLHASKGLEYPVVYLPFICEFKAEKDAKYNSEKGGLTYRVDNRKIELQRAERERLAEDIRLLYVAVTRPVFKLVLNVFSLLDRYGKPSLSQTALGQLLNLESVTNEQALSEHLSELIVQINAADGLAHLNTFTLDGVNELFDWATKKPLSTALEKKALILNSPNKKIEKQWQMWSYSSLVHLLDASPAHSSLDEGFDEFDEIYADEIVETTELIDQFSFPKGADAGTCLHEIFENLDFTLAVSEQVEVLQLALERYGYELKWLPVLETWCQNILNHPLGDFSLRLLPDHKKRVEMEFYFIVQHMQLDAFGNALSMMGLNINLNNVSDIAPCGVIKGFIDLTFEHQGRYYVLDYKSNHLGENLTDYSDSNLHEAMADHNYYLQSLIYVLALHRYLQNAIVDYEYEQHIGGAIYLFLRGCDGDTAEQGVKTINIKHHIIEYLDNALLSGAQEQVVDGVVNETEQTSFGF